MLHQGSSGMKAPWTLDSAVIEGRIGSCAVTFVAVLVNAVWVVAVPVVAVPVVAV